MDKRSATEGPELKQTAPSKGVLALMGSAEPAHGGRGGAARRAFAGSG